MYKGTIIVEKNQLGYCAYPQEFGKRMAVTAEIIGAVLVGDEHEEIGRERCGHGPQPRRQDRERKGARAGRPGRIAPSCGHLESV